MNMDIKALNVRRVELSERMRMMGFMNSPVDPDDQLKVDAAYRLVQDAYFAAEREYQAALAALSADDLYRLVS